MEKKPEAILGPKKTTPLLLRSYELMKQYARATGAGICVHDHNYMPIPELSGELLSEKNICLFCIKYRTATEAKSLTDLSANPCRELHINALKESHRSGGSRTYTCELGFTFWTSQLYCNGRLAGALSGGGSLWTSGEETRGRMSDMCKGALSETEITRMLSRFPRWESQKIKAVAELMLICAQSLSVGSSGCHAAMKRRMQQQSDLSAKIEDLKTRFPQDRAVQDGPERQVPEYPLDKEQTLLEAIRRGDKKTGKETLNELLAFLCFTNPDQFKDIQYRAMELAVLFSRTDPSPAFTAGTILQINNRHLQTIERAENLEELIDALYKILDETVAQIRGFNGIHHSSALKKAEYYILDNFSRKMGLEEIARVSGFSAPYFSTIFKKEMGENLSGYLNRLRVEKAAYMLTDTNLSLGKIAQASGFEDQSWFSKIFKHYTGMSPGKCRKQGGREVSNLPETVFSGEYRLVSGAD